MLPHARAALHLVGASERLHARTDATRSDAVVQGAEVFEQYLVDHDAALNAGNWCV